MKTEFINAIKEANPNTDEGKYRVMDAIKAGRYYLSIQGSEGHYCSPRETLSDIEGYSGMEIAILNGKKEFLNVPKSSTISKFPRYNELMERSDGTSKAMVFGYVPVGLINELYLYLKDT
jgi:hypothetical protein